jgi:hypothetical protein
MSYDTTDVRNLDVDSIRNALATCGPTTTEDVARTLDEVRAVAQTFGLSVNSLTAELSRALSCDIRIFLSGNPYFQLWHERFERFPPEVPKSWRWYDVFRRWQPASRVSKKPFARPLGTPHPMSHEPAQRRQRYKQKRRAFIQRL